jgi:hypothetical protein
VPSYTLVVLAAGLGTRFGGVKQLTPVGPNGEVIFDYTVRDALAAGVDTVVVVTRSEIRADVERHMTTTWPPGIDATVICQDQDPIARAARRAKPLGTAHAAYVGMSASAADAVVVANADDLYGAEPFCLLASEVTSISCALVTFPIGRTVLDDAPVRRALCTVDSGWLSSIDEGTVAGSTWTGMTGRVVALHGDEPTSMNLWAFSAAWCAAFEEASRTLADGGASDIEALLPDVVRDRLSHGQGVRALAWDGPCVGLTHAGDTAAVRQLITGPAWP